MKLVGVVAVATENVSDFLRFQNEFRSKLKVFHYYLVFIGYTRYFAKVCPSVVDLCKWKKISYLIVENPTRNCRRGLVGATSGKTLLPHEVPDETYNAKLPERPNGEGLICAL